MQAPLPSTPSLRPDPVSPQAGYMPQLDGMRTLAVTLVLIQHWLPARYSQGVTWGGYGVDLFFVLSGFLITGILLRTQPEIERGTTPLGYTLRHFTLRRVLRLFPLYYTVLLAITVARDQSPGLQASLWTYTFNVHTLWSGGHDGLVSHFWSLAVEEQFYLLWPWVLLLVPARRLGPVLLGFVLVGPLTRALILATVGPSIGVRTLTPACFDTLCGGAALAWYVHQRGLREVALGTLGRALLVCGLPLFVLGVTLQVLRDGAEPEAWRVMITSTRAPLLGWVVLRSALGFQGWFGRLLASRPMIYLGRRSYGIYVLHAFALLIPLGGLHPLLRFAAYGAATVLAAELSWRFLERPANRLRHRFPYVRPQAGTPADVQRAA